MRGLGFGFGSGSGSASSNRVGVTGQDDNAYVIVNYTVMYDYEKLSYSSMKQAFESLSAELIASVDDGK